MTNQAQFVIAVFELARDQEFTALRLLRSRHGGTAADNPGHIDVTKQHNRYIAACDVVDALQAYADLIGGK